MTDSNDSFFPNDIAPPLNLEASYVYTIEGSILFLLDILLVLLIMTNKNLRKEKVIIIYLANIVYDAFFSLGFVSAGIFRLNLYYNECNSCTNVFYNPWICFNTVHAYFWIIFTPATGFIVLTSALDRLIFVIYPLKYRFWNKRYMVCIALLPFVLSIPFWMFIGIQSYTIGDQYKVPVSCNMLNGNMPGLSYHLRSIRLASSFIAVLLYLPILYKIYKLTTKTSIPKTNVSEQKKLLRSTLTIGLFVANELMFFIFPDVYLYIDIKTRYSYVFYIIFLNKGVGNLLLLCLTQRDIRRAIHAQFTYWLTPFSNLSSMAQAWSLQINTFF